MLQSTANDRGPGRRSRTPAEGAHGRRRAWGGTGGPAVSRRPGISRSRFYELRARYRRYGEAGPPAQAATLRETRPQRQLPAAPGRGRWPMPVEHPHARRADHRPLVLATPPLRWLAGEPWRGRQRPAAGGPRPPPGAAGRGGREPRRVGGRTADPSGSCARCGRSSGRGPSTSAPTCRAEELFPRHLLRRPPQGRRGRCGS